MLPSADSTFSRWVLLLGLSVFCSVFLVVSSSSILHAQSSSAATRSQEIEELYELPPPPGLPEGPAGETVPLTETDEGPGDMGVQRILRRKEPHKYYEIYASESLSFPDNAFLTRRERSDHFWQTRFGARYHPKHPWLKNFTLDASANLYRYHDFESLDFNSYRVAASYNRSLSVLGVQLLTFARGGYSYLEYATSLGTADRGDAFLKQYFLKVGAQKVYPLSRYQYFYGGLSARATSTDYVDGLGTGTIDDPERDSWSTFVGYRYQYSRRIGLSALYRMTNSRYQFIRVPNVHRRDRNHTVSATASYQWNKWLELNLTYNYANNNSNSRVFEYEANTFGGGGYLNWRF